MLTSSAVMLQVPGLESDDDEEEGQRGSSSNSSASSSSSVGSPAQQVGPSLGRLELGLHVLLLGFLTPVGTQNVDKMLNILPFQTGMAVSCVTFAAVTSACMTLHTL